MVDLDNESGNESGQAASRYLYSKVLHNALLFIVVK